MHEEPINPNDPGFLLSRRLDGDLTDDERRRLDKALESSASLRAEAESIGRLNDLLGRWAETPVELDWETHAALIGARCHTDDTSQDQLELVGVLQRWSQEDVDFDEDEFTAGVMRRVGDTRNIDGPASRRWMMRVAVPLAAAAVLMFALIGGPWALERLGSGVAENQLADTASVDSNPFEAPVCVVRFARVMPSEPIEASPIAVGRPSGMSFTAIGVVTGGLSMAPSSP